MAVVLLLPSLISSVSCVVKMLYDAYNMALCSAFILGIFPLFPGYNAFWCLLIAAGFAGIHVPLAKYAAKGKLWCFLVMGGLHVADTVYALVLFDQIGALTFGLNIALHFIFLVAFAFGVSFYLRADKILKAHPEEILQQKDS